MNYPDFSLENKNIVLTGASRGLGKYIALTLANAGANIILVSRNIEKENAIEKEIIKMGRKVYSFPCDISNIEKIKELFSFVQDKFGDIDILINNAGVAMPEYAVNVTPEQWDKTHSVDLRGLFFCCQEFGKQKINKNTKGKIINITSTFSVVGYPKRSAYASAKGGVVQLTKVLALEWAKYDITVNAVSPTAMRTEMIENLLKDEKQKKDLIERIPLGRLAEVEDVTGAIVFLCSSASNFITGINLLVDGGWTAQ